MKRFFAKALLCAGVVFATVVAGLVFHQNFSWQHLQAEVAEFFRILAHGDVPQVISALTSATVLTIVGLVIIGALLLWDIYIRDRRPGGRGDAAQQNARRGKLPGGRRSSDGK